VQTLGPPAGKGLMGFFTLDESASATNPKAASADPHHAHHSKRRRRIEAEPLHHSSRRPTTHTIVRPFPAKKLKLLNQPQSPKSGMDFNLPSSLPQASLFDTRRAFREKARHYQGKRL